MALGSGKGDRPKNMKKDKEQHPLAKNCNGLNKILIFLKTRI
jgi:hypothetical protein